MMQKSTSFTMIFCVKKVLLSLRYEKKSKFVEIFLHFSK
jgi:hypothetical protein